MYEITSEWNETRRDLNDCLIASLFNSDIRLEFREKEFSETEEVKIWSIEYVATSY